MGVIARPRAGHRLARPPSGAFTLNRDSPQAKGLVAWWPFLGSAGTSTIRDLSGGYPSNSFSGSLVWLNHADTGPYIDFATADYFDFGSPNGLRLPFPFSLVAILRYTTTSNLVVAEHNGNTGFSLQTTASPSGGLWLNSGGGIETNTTKTNNAWNNNQWHRVVFSMLSTTASANRVYVDGTDNTTDGRSSLAPSYGTYNMQIGSRAGASGFGGDIAELRLYNYALSANLAYQIWSPETRYDLYLPAAPPRFWSIPVAGGGSTYEETLTLARTGAVTEATILLANDNLTLTHSLSVSEDTAYEETLTLARSNAVTEATALTANDNLALAHSLSISEIGTLQTNWAVTLSLGLAITTGNDSEETGGLPLGDKLINGPLIVKANKTNLGYVYLGNAGDNTVSSSTGIILAAGDEVIFKWVGNVKSIIMASSLEGEGVSWIRLK